MLSGPVSKDYICSTSEGSIIAIYCAMDELLYGNERWIGRRLLRLLLIERWGQLHVIDGVIRGCHFIGSIFVIIRRLYAKCDTYSFGISYG